MPTPADSPLRKVTLNLYEADVEAAQAYFGQGWSVVLRDIWHDYMRTTVSHRNTRKTLEDLTK